MKIFINNKSKTLHNKFFASPTLDENNQKESIKCDKNEALASIMKMYTYKFLKSPKSLADANLSTTEIFQNRNKQSIYLDSRI